MNRDLTNVCDGVLPPIWGGGEVEVTLPAEGKGRSLACH